MDTGGRLIHPDDQPQAKRPPRPASTDTPPKEPTKDAKPDHEHGPEPICRYCGWNQKFDPAVPTQEDAVAFRDAVFSGELFTKTIDMFDGAVSLTLRDLTSDENLAAKVLVAAAVINSPKTTTWEGMTTLSTGFCLGMAVTKLRVGKNTFTATPVTDPATENLEARLTLVRKFCGSDLVYRSVREQYAKFIMALGVLMTRAADRGFYSATGPAGGTPASPSV